MLEIHSVVLTTYLASRNLSFKTPQINQILHHPGGFRDEAEAKPFTCLDGRTAQDASRNQLMSGVITSSDPVFYRWAIIYNNVILPLEHSPCAPCCPLSGCCNPVISGRFLTSGSRQDGFAGINKTSEVNPDILESWDFPTIFRPGKFLNSQFSGVGLFFEVGPISR